MTGLDGAGGYLEINYCIPFRQCVVSCGSEFFVPISLGHKNGYALRMLQLLPDGTGRYDDDKTIEWLYSSKVSVVGYLPYIILQCNKSNVISWADGTSRHKEKYDTEYKIATMPEYDAAQPEATLLEEPSLASFKTSTQVLLDARCTPSRPSSMHSTGVRRYGEVDGWIIFRGWQFPHRFVGDPFVRRVHIFSRAMRQVPAGTNVRV